jgi:transmembrane sensor
MKKGTDIDPALAADAARWAARLGAEDASEAEWLSFEAWLSVPEHRAAYDGLENQLAEIEAHKDELRRAIRYGPRAAAQPGSRAKSPVWLWGGGLAAVAAALAIVALPAISRWASALDPVQELAYAAPADQPSSFTLPDGSSVTLNRGASLHVRFAERRREVSLGSGEASFQVTHDERRPFLVHAGTASIKDLGTEFNVMNLKDTLLVTVRAGAVEVDLEGGNPVRLQEGGQLRVDRNESVATVSRVNPEDAFAWMNGRLVFRNARLGEIIAQMNRYGDKPIQLADGGLGDLRFSGVLVIGNSETMISQIVAFLPVRMDESGEAISLRAK